MAKLILSDITSGYLPIVTVNANSDATEVAFENTLSRDGTGPNHMESHFDMNSFRILNLGEPLNASEAATKAYVDAHSGATGATGPTGPTGPAGPSGAGSGDMLAANNLSDVASVATALTNLGLVIGTNVQAYNINLTAINQALTTTSTPSFTTVTANLTGTASLATSLAGGSGGTIPYQSAAGVTAMLANGTAGKILQSNGTTVAPSWETLTATTATTATNIAGGLGGSVPYQTAVNTTAMLANGTAGQVLQSNGTTLAPSWATLAGTGDLIAANNLSDVASAATSRTNLGLGTGNSPTFTAVTATLLGPVNHIGTENFTLTPGVISPGKAANAIHQVHTEASLSGTLLWLEHEDRDTTTYTSPTTYQGNGLVIYQRGLYSAGAFQTQYKDMHAIVGYAQQKNSASYPTKGVSAFIGVSEQYGGGVATNEFHVRNPSTSSAQASSLIAVQAIVKPDMGDSDITHSVDCVFALNEGTGRARSAFLAYDIGGGGFDVGVDLSYTTYAVSPLRIPNNAYIYALNAAGTSNVEIIKARTDNTIQLGIGCSIAGSFLPTANNTYNLGSASLKWANVYTTTFTATSLGGTLTTAAQPNITSVGTLTALAVATPINGNVLGTSAATTLGANTFQFSGTPSSSASGTATFTGTKPGGNATNLWQTILLNGATWWVPVWAN